MSNTARAQSERPLLIAGPPALALAALAVYALAVDGAGADMATLTGINVLVAIGYQIVFGRLGALSLAQGAFFGLGAFVTARLAAAGFPFPVTFPAAILLPALIAAVVVGPVLRLQPYFFPLVTIGLAQLLLGAAHMSGAFHDVPAVQFAGTIGIARGPGLALFVWAIAIVGGVAVWFLSDTHFGRFIEVARDNPLAAGAIGLDAGRMRLQAFVLSAAYGGAAGALHAHATGAATANDFGLPVMTLCIAAALLGGRRQVTGTVVGVILLQLAAGALRLPEAYSPALYGIVILIALRALPNGLLGLLERRFARPSVVVSPAPQPIIPRKPARIAGPLLAARGITRRFGGVIAVDNISLALQPGEILGIIGPNGSGKTTLLNALSGLSPAQTGRIFLSGRDITSLPPHQVSRAGLSRSFQTPQLADGLTALDNIAAARLALRGEGASMFVAPTKADAALARARAEAMTCLEAVDLVSMAATPAGMLTLAHRRRLEIARALALNPLVVAFDEPAAGLDPDESDALAALLQSLAARGLGVIVVEHQMTFLASIATRLACLDAGRLIVIGPTESVMADPKVAAAYLGASVIGRGRIR